MDVQATAVFLRLFSDLKDPRRPNVRHLFTDILIIAVLAVLCHSDDWIEGMGPRPAPVAQDELNRRHTDFQSSKVCVILGKARY